MNRTAIQNLVATASRRALTAAEQADLDACLKRDSDLRAVWQEEEQLNALLRTLPEPALGSNFTARVLDQVGRQTDARRPAWRWVWLGRLWPVRHAWQAAVALLLGVLLLQTGLRRTTTHTEMASLLSALPANGLANVELWRDFESIRRLPDGPLPSVNELAEALQ